LDKGPAFVEIGRKGLLELSPGQAVSTGGKCSDAILIEITPHFISTWIEVVGHFREKHKFSVLLLPDLGRPRW
jgi:hypothetical protein